ncbi:hypothetical protein ACFL08_04875 [Patescibacteria group bacterium]
MSNESRMEDRPQVDSCEHLNGVEYSAKEILRLRDKIADLEAKNAQLKARNNRLESEARGGVWPWREV